MRLVTFAGEGPPGIGMIGPAETLLALEDLAPVAPLTMLQVIERWSDLRPLLLGEERRPHQGVPLSRVRLLAPIPRPARNLFCVGWNYAEHFEEGAGFRGSSPTEAPEHPALFSKSPATVVGPDAPVRHPGPHSSELDWEVELAVVIGRAGRDISETRALDHVFGYTIANDVSVRDHQRARHGGQWFKGKSFDTHCPLGPWIVTSDEIADPQTLPISSRINGETKQSSNTRHMVFSVRRIIAELSAGMALEPGDVILTGTPSGVGFARTPPEYLNVGDRMEMEVGGIGVLRNTITPYATE